MFLFSISTTYCNSAKQHHPPPTSDSFLTRTHTPTPLINRENACKSAHANGPSAWPEKAIWANSVQHEFAQSRLDFSGSMMHYNSGRHRARPDCLHTHTHTMPPVATLQTHTRPERMAQQKTFHRRTHTRIPISGLFAKAIRKITATRTRTYSCFRLS